MTLSQKTGSLFLTLLFTQRFEAGRGGLPEKASTTEAEERSLALTAAARRAVECVGTARNGGHRPRLVGMRRGARLGGRGRNRRRVRGRRGSRHIVALRRRGSRAADRRVDAQSDRGGLGARLGALCLIAVGAGRRPIQALAIGIRPGLHAAWHRGGIGDAGDCRPGFGCRGEQAKPRISADHSANEQSRNRTSKRTHQTLPPPAAGRPPPPSSPTQLNVPTLLRDGWPPTGAVGPPCQPARRRWAASRIASIDIRSAADFCADTTGLTSRVVVLVTLTW